MTFQNGMSSVFDPRRLRLLLEVERRGSISAAAEACGMSQPSATKHLKTLAGAVGERLLRREGRGSALTEAGHVVAGHAARVLGALTAMEDELRALRDGERGTLTIAASTTPGTYVLPAILKCFAERHPGVDVDVSIGPSAWVVRRIATREAQLGLAGEVDTPPTVSIEHFLDDELVGIAAPGELTVRRGEVSLEQLATRTLLVRERGSSTRAAAERHLVRAGFRPAKTWELDSNEAIKQAVLAGLGIGFVSRLVVEHELGRGELVAFRPAGVGPMTRAIQLIHADDRHLTPSERAFVHTLSDCCSTTVPACAVERTPGPLASDRDDRAFAI